jgi:nucleoid-associated protein YgaU
LAEHNRSKNPDTHQLRVGDEIDAPSASTLEASYPQLCPKPSHREAIEHRASVAGTVPQPSGSNVYTVQAGDTLFDIARYELGKASRWVEIYQLNRERLGKDFDYLTPGLKLAMPADASSETVTQQPAASFRR